MCFGFGGYMGHFPSFSEGLSLRVTVHRPYAASATYFPSFSEGLSLRGERNLLPCRIPVTFPFLFGGTFIEGCECSERRSDEGHFPSFSEGLSLRGLSGGGRGEREKISLPFRRDFH